MNVECSSLLFLSTMWSTNHTPISESRENSRKTPRKNLSLHCPFLPPVLMYQNTIPLLVHWKSKSPKATCQTHSLFHTCQNNTASSLYYLIFALIQHPPTKPPKSAYLYVFMPLQILKNIYKYKLTLSVGVSIYIC